MKSLCVLSHPSLVWMSITPAVRYPYCCGQYAVHHADALDEIGVQQLRERRVGVDVQRQHNPVHLVLDTHMLAANVNLLVLIQRHPRHLQHHLVERRGVAVSGRLVMSLAVSVYLFVPVWESPFCG